jgi:hypothetical protein
MIAVILAALLTVHAVFTSGPAQQAPLEITLFRWSADADRAPLVAALSAPPAPPASAAAPAAGRAGRAGRGAPPPPPSPMARLEAAIKAAPTCGYIWTSGVTGYSIKYAWHAPASEGGDRVVLVADRRLGGPVSSGPDFTIIEMQLDEKGSGDAKVSLDAKIVADAAAKTIAIDRYGSAPMLLKVTK